MIENKSKRKEQIIACIGNLKYNSIASIFGVSVPYIFRLKKQFSIPTEKYINKNRLDRRKKEYNISIKFQILDYFNITDAQLKSKSRKVKYVDARMFLIHYLIKNTHLNWRELGGEVNRDHSSAINYPKRMKKELFYQDTIAKKKELDKIIEECL